MVRNRLPVLLRAGNRLEQLFPHQPVEQLRVMEDVKVPVEVRVLVAQRVKAVRAGGDDLPLPLRYALKGFVEGLHILLRHHLEQELVAGAAGRIARAGFTGGQHAELHAGGVQQIHGRAGRRAARVVVGAGAADPQQVLEIGEIRVILADDGHLDAIGTRLVDPGAALAGVAAPRVALGLNVLEQPSQLRRELGVREHAKAAQVCDVVDVLDVHRALVHARAAVGARPQHVIRDNVRHGTRHGQYVDAGMRVIGTQGVRVGGRNRALFDVQHELFRAQRLLRVPRRAEILAAAALGTHGRIQQHLPRRVLQLAYAQRVVVLDVVQVDILVPRRHRVERAERLLPVRVALEVDIERRGKAVPGDTPAQVTAHQDQKDHAGQQLHQREDGNQHRGGGQQRGDARRDRIRPPRVAEGGDLGRLDQQHSQALDEHDGLNGVGGTLVGVEEAAGARVGAGQLAYRDEVADAEDGSHREDLLR